MYGLIGKMRTTPGQRDTVIGQLLDGIRNMPGCLSRWVGRDCRSDTEKSIASIKKLIG